jgi:class 3 adenylate cyclase/pSer/pThr/pTyr-binding forkhead associated (FHA) protein
MPQSSSVTQIIQSSRKNAEILAELEKFRRTITVMFTDIKGSTAYFEKYGDVAGLMMVHQCNDALRQIVEKHGGRVVKTIGDAIMATFDDAGGSVQAAIEMQHQLIEFNKPKPEQDHVFIRIGLNYGAGIVKSNDVFGDVVNVASRVESVALPEQIVISDSLNQQVAQLGKFRISHLGRFALKGKEGDRDLFEVTWTEHKVDRPPAAHTLVTSPKASLVLPKYKLQHIRKDGSVGSEHELKGGQLVVGRAEGDLKFSNDAQLAARHARFFSEKGQLLVEDLAPEGRGVYVRLIATYMLQDGDVLMMGRRAFRFKEKPEAMAAGAAVGSTVTDIASLLKEPVAEFIALKADGSVDEVARFPLNEQEVTWGRTKGTYTFPEDGFMSRSHAKVYQRGENFFLEDSGSRNGTFVKVHGKSPVPVGAMVLVGGQLLKVTQ